MEFRNIVEFIVPDEIDSIAETGDMQTSVILKSGIEIVVEADFYTVLNLFRDAFGLEFELWMYAKTKEY